jgi:DNA (cytosine-5)-methyltransferase 1
MKKLIKKNNTTKNINKWIDNEESQIKNKIKVISLFSGSGGLDLGFLTTGKFEIVFANDFNKFACETYKNNIGDHILCEDISKIKNLPKADIIIGGPPCQGFSTANPARSFEDPRNQLFKEYSRIIKNVKPKLFLMENVSGMVTMNNGEVFKLIKKELTNNGYKLYDELLNSKDFGVPQSRRRMIIIGVRDDIKSKFEFPKKTHNENNYVTVGETIIQKPVPVNNPNHKISNISELNYQRLKYIPEGGSMKDCPIKYQNNSDLKRAMRRLNSKKESYTIVHNNCDHYYHPTENRRITIREMARLQGYPDEYIFSGSKSEQSRQVGNSVPIGLGKVLAKSIFKFLKLN